MFQYENQAKEQGFDFIIGIDEAGRGPLAGPVVASAVSIKKFDFKNKINDSKKLNLAQRDRAFNEIFENAHVGVGIINEKVIDECNILEATYIAMENAVRDLMARIPDDLRSQHEFSSKVLMLIDGNRFKSGLRYKHKTVI